MKPDREDRSAGPACLRDAQLWETPLWAAQIRDEWRRRSLATGWRIVLSSPNATPPGLYIRRGQLPTNGSYDKASVGHPIDTIIFTSAEATNSTYFIGVYLPAGPASSANYILTTELASVTTLTWDPGTTDAGTQVFTNLSGTGGDYYFAITTMGTADADLSDTIWALGLSVGTPRGLRAIGLTEAQVEQAAETALAKGLSSPRALDRAGLHRLLEAAWRGMSPSIT